GNNGSGDGVVPRSAASGGAIFALGAANHRVRRSPGRYRPSPARNDPMTTTPVALGQNLARLVWENFTDFLETAPVGVTTGPDGDVVPDLVPEELLILFLWVHTRACQQALATRVPPDTLKATLDALHRTVLEDMEAHGASRAA